MSRLTRILKAAKPGTYPRKGSRVEVIHSLKYEAQKGTVLGLRGLGFIRVRLDSGEEISIEGTRLKYLRVQH